MLTSLALIFLVGLSAAGICRRLKLLRIIGMLITGIVLGPYALDFLDPSILSISAELRQAALIIILLKAGLSLDPADLRRVGRPAVLMSFLPASFEILAFVLSPRTSRRHENRSCGDGRRIGSRFCGGDSTDGSADGDEARTSKSIPQLIMAGVSLVMIFSSSCSFRLRQYGAGRSAHMTDFINIPCFNSSGNRAGALIGYLSLPVLRDGFTSVSTTSETAQSHHCTGTSFLLMAVETWLKGTVSVSGLLSVVSMACMLKIQSPGSVSNRLSENSENCGSPPKSSLCF